MSNKKSKSELWTIISCIVLGCILIASRYIFRTFFDDLFNKGTHLSDIIFIFTTIVCFFLLWYYIDTNVSKGVNTFHQTGQNISNLFKWLFSVNGLFVLLIFAVVALVFFIIRRGNDETNDVQLQLISVTLTITLSALIPTMISRIVTKNQLNDIIEQKLETELVKYKTSLYSIRKDKGHASRMSAVLLEQMSDPKGSFVEIQTCQNNAAWSIGWASDAIIQYVLIRDVYSNAIKNSAACLNIIYKSAHHIKCDDTGQIMSEIKPRDLKSLITMHSLILQSGLADIIQEDANQQRLGLDFVDANKSPLLAEAKWQMMIESLEIIEKAFYRKYQNQKNVKPIDFSNFCAISGMPGDFNEELNAHAKRIIIEMLKA